MVVFLNVVSVLQVTKCEQACGCVAPFCFCTGCYSVCLEGDKSHC